MDEEIKSSAELEKALEEQVTGEIPDLTEPMDQLKTAGEALTELVDIRDTIQVEGVSQEDVRSVFDLIQRVTALDGIEGITTSLEDYELGHYTPTRSIVNQQVSLEGIGETIMKVIKVLIEKLIEFVAGLVRKYKIWQAGDKKNDRAFEMARNKAKDVQDTITQLRRYALTATTDIDNQVLEFAKATLKASDLPRTAVTLAAMFDARQIDAIKGLQAKAEESTRYLRASTKSIKLLLTGGNEGGVDLTAIDYLSILRQTAEQLMVANPDPGYLLEHIDPKQFIDGTIRKQAVPIVQYEYLVKAFFSIADDLRTIRRFNPSDMFDEDSARDVSDTINQMTQGFENLDLIVQFMAHVKAVQMKVFKIQLQILNRYTSLLLLHIRETTVHEASRRSAEDAFSKLEKKLRAYGV